MILKAYKYRLYPNAVQKQQFEKSINVCRFVYNLALETKIYAYRSHGVNLSAFDLCYQLVDLKKENKWIAEVSSQSLLATMKNVDNAFKNFFRGGGYPRYKRKGNAGSFQCPGNKREVDFENSTLTIPKISEIPIRLSRKFEGKIKTVTVSRTPTGKYFASILVESNEDIPKAKQVVTETTIGIDAGVKALVVTSDGKSFESNRRLKNSLKRLQCLQRRASKKKKGSNNRKKANKCVAILHEKIINQRTDYIHKVTHALTHDNQVDSIVIEDLNVAGMLKNRKLSQALSDVSFGELFRQLKYKSEWYGKNLITIGRFEPTSKMCSVCGEINESMTLTIRDWVCANCGTSHERDFNAAKNIKHAGLKKYSPEGIRAEPVELRRIRRAKKQEVTK